MEVRNYLNILIGKWWLILLTVAITLGAVNLVDFFSKTNLPDFRHLYRAS